MHHLFLSYQPSRDQLSKERCALEGWCADRGLADYAILEEKLTSGRISKNMIRKALRAVQKGDTVVAMSLSRLGRGINMLQLMVTIILEKGASIHIIDENRTYCGGPESELMLSHLDFAMNIVKKIKAERGNEALQPKREAGTVHGRPTGAKKHENKLVLYGKEETIKRLLSEGKNALTIAKEIDVSRSTVYNYIRTLKKH